MFWRLRAIEGLLEGRNAIGRGALCIVDGATRGEIRPNVFGFDPEELEANSGGSVLAFGGLAMAC